MRVVTNCVLSKVAIRLSTSLKKSRLRKSMTSAIRLILPDSLTNSQKVGSRVGGILSIQK